MITTRVEIFKKIGGNIPDGNFLGEIFPSGNSPGEEKIYAKNSQVYMH